MCVCDRLLCGRVGYVRWGEVSRISNGDEELCCICIGYDICGVCGLRVGGR